MKRFIAVLSAIALGLACLSALAQQKRETPAQEAREAKDKVKEEANESRAEKKAERQAKKAKKKARKAKEKAETK